jgi:hypothetical protein
MLLDRLGTYLSIGSLLSNLWRFHAQKRLGMLDQLLGLVETSATPTDPAQAQLRQYLAPALHLLNSKLASSLIRKRHIQKPSR